MTASEMDQLCIDTIRALAIDAIQKAESGHPGTPMGIAPVAYGLRQKWLNFHPSDPIWPLLLTLLVGLILAERQGKYLVCRINPEMREMGRKLFA